MLDSRWIILLFLHLGFYSCTNKKPLAQNTIRLVSFSDKGMRLNSDSLKESMDLHGRSNALVGIREKRNEVLSEFNNKIYPFLDFTSDEQKSGVLKYVNGNYIDSFNYVILGKNEAYKYTNDTILFVSLSGLSSRNICNLMFAVDNRLKVRATMFGYLSSDRKRFSYIYEEGDKQLFMNFMYIRCIKYYNVH